MSESSREAGFLSLVRSVIEGWLAGVRGLVFSAGRLYPDPSGVMARAGDWLQRVRGQLIPALEQTAAEAWEEESGQPYVSNNSFVLAQLALTENLLVNIPNEVYNRVFAAIVDGQQAGESREQIADRVDEVLFLTGSDWWEARARTIAQTETHRAWQSGILASALYYEPATGPGWVKEWHTEMDGRERPSHKRANGQVRRLSEPFSVGGALLRYPGDAAGPPDEVINCRCDMIIRER